METADTKYGTKEQGLKETLRKDFTDASHFKTFKKELKDVKDFYISQDMRRRLADMNRLKRAYYYVWWVFKGMMLKLTPLRRVLLIIGIVFLISSANITISDEDSVDKSVSRGIIGGALIVFVLILELKDKVLARSELLEGRRVQLALMPDTNPNVRGWSVWLYSKPANEICGDLVDFIDIDDRKTGLFLADVAGKGLNAALLTTKLQAIVRTLALENTIFDLITKVNRIFYRESLRRIFASLLYAEILPDTNTIKYVNAGQLPPVLIGAEGVKKLPKGDPALGLLSDTIYTISTLELQAGEMFVAYTDGVTEARSESGEFFGIDRFYGMLGSLRNHSAEEAGRHITSEIESFTGGSYLYDDISLLIIKKV